MCLKDSWILVFVCLMGHFALLAQGQLSDTLIWIDSVQVEAKANHHFQLRASKLDIHDILSNRSVFFIKDYGPNQLKTLSVRGASAGQNAVLWNGVDINSPMLGQIDLSQISYGTHNSLRLSPSGGANETNVIGGEIKLNTNFEFIKKRQIEIGALWGSYGQQNIHATYNSVKDDQKSITKLMLGRAENDFNFKNNRAELRQMVHSDYDLWSVAHSRLWSLSEKADIEAHVWFRGQRLNLGPTIHQDTSEAQQRDKSYRGLIKWRTRWNKIDIKNDLAILHDRIRYTDPQISIDDPANSTVYNWRFNVSRFYKNYKTYGGLDLNYATAKSANYNDSQKRWASNVFLGIHKYWQKGHRTEFLVKQYWFEDQFLTPSFKLQHRARLSDRWAMVAAGARALRIPSMNDLYWSPGGNAQLKPESAWKSEFTVQFNKSSNNNFEADLSGFSTWTRDWILWRPVSGTLWSPVNIRKVWSRGFNAQIENEWNIGSDQKLLTSISYEYVRATYQNSLNVRDISIGKQLIYTPQHSANFRLSYHHKNLELGTTTVYKGTTYTSSDNIQKLPDYVLIDAHMGCHLSIGKMEGLIEISSKNINNQSYQVITARAMPLRNYYVKLILNTN